MDMQIVRIVYPGRASDTFVAQAADGTFAFAATSTQAARQVMAARRRGGARFDEACAFNGVSPSALHAALAPPLWNDGRLRVVAAD